MDDQNRMMHYQQHAFGMGLADQTGQQPSPAGGGGQEEAGQQQDGTRGHTDINTILDQIMNITDQSLDEAQVSFLHHLLAWSNIPARALSVPINAEIIKAVSNPIDFDLV